jgi:hypothetical protein
MEVEMQSRKNLWVLSLIFCGLQAVAGQRTGLVEDPDPAGGTNQALLVAVGHGLPGLDIDIANLEKIVTAPVYSFEPTVLNEAQGTSTDIEENLETLSRDTGSGTLLFYFTGHGNVGSIYPYDGTMKITRIRDAIQRGRQGAGPLNRLVMIYDACHSGTFLDPFRKAFPPNRLGAEAYSAFFIDNVMQDLGGNERSEERYFKNLFILASTEPDETCLASPDGSYFTNALMSAYEEVMSTNGTLRELYEKTKAKTVGSTPTARFTPASLALETLY